MELLLGVPLGSPTHIHTPTPQQHYIDRIIQLSLNQTIKQTICDRKIHLFDAETVLLPQVFEYFHVFYRMFNM